ncbi:MAG: helix-turn-helix domain-containing protein [Tissierellaceae bacterium]|nr:helix-turn-helix domain-containing protein [Tissierellaceae bacterium]
MSLNNIGDRIKEIRGKQSRAEFAEALGIHPQTLYLYEKNKRTIDVALIQKICLQFGVSAEWLIFGEDRLQALLTQSSPELSAEDKADEYINSRLKEKEQQLEIQEEYINKIKNDLIDAQNQTIKSYELALKAILENSDKDKQ